MLHAISVQRSRCIWSFWPEYLSANLWNVWCRINIKSRFGIHGCANEIWSSLFSLPICKSIYVLILDDLDYEDMLSSFYSKEKEISIKWMNEANDVLLAWLFTVSSRLCGLADHWGCFECSGISAVPSDTSVVSIFMCFLNALLRKFVVSVDWSHGEGLKLVKMSLWKSFFSNW